jgi:hypothetical protein
VEGAEADVLVSMADALYQHAPVILIEIFPVDTHKIASAYNNNTL